ncbi:MAG: glycosyltransferase family 39 protein [Saprospiraceae bacterium]|nr:glycosyltransferase family 39 protein [Saprospiraceae bacterium]
MSAFVDGFMFDVRLHRIILLALPFLIYANTLNHEFVLDDGIVITENKFVKQGVSGIPELLTKDSFYGFFQKQGKEKLVAGGRYRPMSLMVFAFVFEIFGPSSFVFHLLSILVYALLSFAIYVCIRKLFLIKFNKGSEAFAFLIALLFCTHPVHTECVANVKGMDESLALLFCMVAFYYFLIYLDERKYWQLMLTGIMMFFGLLSKENAISYVALIPFGAAVLYTDKLKSLKWPSLMLVLAALVFILLRANTLGLNPFTKLSTELMNNPFMKFENGQKVAMDIFEKAGIITYCLFEYLRLMVWPYPLTHDYYPKQIPMLGIGSINSIAAICIYSFAILFVLIKMKRYPAFSYSVAAFILPLFLVSNILFPIGTNMGERFIFMPSLGFIIGFVFLIQYLNKQNWSKSFYMIAPVCILFSVLTILRNPAWTSNQVLFDTDLKTSVKSAKIHNAVAGVLLESAPAIKDSAELRRVTAKAKLELEKALSIHPVYMEAHLQMGNIYYFEKDYVKAIEKYNYILKHLPDDEDAFKNLQMALRERGRQLGQAGQVKEAREYIKNALGMNPNDSESLMLMGIAEGSSGNNNLAIEYFRKAAQMDPKNPQVYINLGIAFKNDGDLITSDSMFAAAKAIDPEILKKNGIQSK